MEMHRYRTHKCDELRKEQAEQTVKLSGWIHSVRDHGGIIFIDLRDHYGITQVVINPERDFYQNLEHWRVETVVCFTGQVIERSPETINPQINTGEIAPGIDRILMLLSGESNLREVIAFPFNQRAEDLMMNAPSNVTEEQLRELSIKPVIRKKTASGH